MSAAPSGPIGLRLLDLAALIVGYGLAAMGLRALWPRDVAPTAALIALAAVAYAWLGLAMSGPFALLLDRRPAPATGEQARYTRAEVAWLLIGAYWIAAAMLIIPARADGRVGAVVVAPVPLFAAALLWLLAARPAARPTGWTHLAALAVLLTWPVAWLALIVLISALD